jgi:hypothetical protein
MFRRHLFLVVAAVLLYPAISTAGPQWGINIQFGSQNRFNTPYELGYQRGARSGEEDASRGDRFNYADETVYRNADDGYRIQFGDRDRYRIEFRRGFEAGYTEGYRRFDLPGRRGVGPGRGTPGTPTGRGYGRYDEAVLQGFNDGYEAGLDDGQDGRRFDPVRESRYRNADRGYDRNYGPKELYRTNYRDGFRRGYEDGYNDGRRYNDWR